MNDENTKAVDDLYKQLNEMKGQLEASEMKCDKLQTSVSKKKEKLTSNSLKIQELETSLTAKVLQLSCQLSFMLVVILLPADDLCEHFCPRSGLTNVGSDLDPNHLSL